MLGKALLPDFPPQALAELEASAGLRLPRMDRREISANFLVFDR